MATELVMGVARAFDDILKSQANFHAAWFPITNTFQVGDYGVIGDGVFVKLGNIQDDYGIPIATERGDDAKLNFASKGTRVTKLAGGAEVTAFPAQPIEAKLSLEFDHESAFLIKANLSLLAMPNIASVAKRLAQADGWKRKYRVVSGVYTGHNCSIISSTGANSKIELSGKADALKELDLGNVAVGISTSTSEQIGIELVGKTGAIGLSLFKLPMFFGDEAQTLAEEEQVYETDWDTLTDDI